LIAHGNDLMAGPRSPSLGEIVKVGLVGLGGYSAFYLNRLLDQGDQFGARLVGAMDPLAEHCPRLHELRRRRIPVFADMERLLREQAMDLCIVSSPIPFHAEQSIAALEAGAHVLCEKPAAATLAEADAMAAASQRTGRFCAIGFQWSFSTAVNTLKNDILAGRFGAPRRFKTIVFRPRPESYYRRCDWAGKLQTAQGRWILDSPAQNATAHFWHNMFFLVGAQPNRAAMPVSVQAELYRAKPIENFDTAAVRCHTADGLEILFYTSHSVPDNLGPHSEFAFDEATVQLTKTGEWVARWANGAVESYGNPNTDGNDLKLSRTLDAARGGPPATCDIWTARPHLAGVTYAHASCPHIAPFPRDMITVTERPDGDRLVHARGLDAALRQCYRQDALPSEIGGLSWSRPGRRVGMSRDISSVIP